MYLIYRFVVNILDNKNSVIIIINNFLIFYE
jgi:hypothetical protein